MEKIQTILLILLLLVSPFIIRVILVPFTAPCLNDDVISTGFKGDTYSYYKWFFLIAISMALLVSMFYRMFAHKSTFQKNYLTIPLFLLSFFMMLSLFTAEYKMIAIKGLYDRHEGVLAYLCFFTIAFCIAHIQTPIQKLIRITAICFSVPLIINTLVILTHLWDSNMGKLPLLQKLIIPKGIDAWIQMDTIFFNQNYSSGLTCAACYFYLAFAIGSDSWKKRALSISMACICFASMLGSLSMSGFVTFLALLPFFLIACLWKFHKVQVLSVFTVCMLLFSSLGLLLHYTEKPADLEIKRTIYTESIGGVSNLIQKTFQKIFPPNRQDSLAPSLAEHPLFAPPKEEDLEEFFFPTKGFSLGTGRAYLWIETWQYIMQRPITGYGMDTFPYYYNHYKKDKIANLGHTDDVLMTKPHNFYLGIAFGAGIPTLILFLAFLSIHFYKTFFIYKKCQEQPYLVYQLSFFFFLSAFCIQWIFNDSILATSIFFWCFLGLAANLNFTITREINT